MSCFVAYAPEKISPKINTLNSSTDLARWTFVEVTVLHCFHDTAC